MAALAKAAKHFRSSTERSPSHGARTLQSSACCSKTRTDDKGTHLRGVDQKWTSCDTLDLSTSVITLHMLNTYLFFYIFD